MSTGKRSGVGYQEQLANRRIQFHKAERRDHHAVRGAQPYPGQPAIFPSDQHQVVFPRIVPQLFRQGRNESQGSSGREVNHSESGIFSGGIKVGIKLLRRLHRFNDNYVPIHPLARNIRIQITTSTVPQHSRFYHTRPTKF